MSDRFGPKTIEPELVKDIWSEVKNMRDEMKNREAMSRHAADRCDELLTRMKAAGMCDWIPTLEEVQAAWRDHQ